MKRRADAMESQMLIQKLRIQRGWSQEQLAELSGLSTRTVQRLERSGTGSAESLKAIASVLEVDFITLKEQPMDASKTEAGAPISEKVPQDEALAHVRKVKAFYIHLVQYVAICALICAINLAIDPAHLWSLWVVGFWGLAVAGHALQVFEAFPFLGGEWERREVEKRLGRSL